MPRTACLLLLLAGCAGTIRGYEGELEGEEAAVIVSHCASAVRLRIVEIDGLAVDRRWSRLGRLELRPGQHSISLRLHWRPGLFRFPASGFAHPENEAKNMVLLPIDLATAREGTTDVFVTVEAGRRYVLRARIDSEGRARCEITDAGTGALVAGEPLDGILAPG